MTGAVLIELAPKERLRIGGRDYAVDRRVEDGIQLVRADDGAYRTFPDLELADMFMAGTMLRLPPGAGPGSDALAAPVADFARASERDRDEASRRGRYLDCIARELGSPPFTDARLVGAIDHAHDSIEDAGEKPSLRTMRRWVAAQVEIGGWDGQEVKANLLAQLPNRHLAQGRHKPKFCRLTEDLMTGVIEERCLTRHPDGIYGAFAVFVERFNERNGEGAEAPPRPCFTTFYNRVVDVDAVEALAAKKGRKAAKQAFDRIGTPPIEHRPMAVVEVDHNYVDCMLVDDDGVLLGRPILSCAIDRATRMCVGFALTMERPSRTSLMLLMRHMVRPKTYVAEHFGGHVKDEWPCFGVPISIVVDNAVEFHSDAFKSTLKALGNINPIYATPETPKQKAIVERFFGTLNKGLFHLIPGTTLSHIDRASDYDPATAARVTLRNLNLQLHKFIVDIYHQRGHGGVGEVPPIRLWTEGVALFPLRLPPSLADYEIFTRVRTTRTLSRRGIEIHSMFYCSDDLTRLFQKAGGDIEVAVYWNPANLDDIHVERPDGKGWVTALSTMRGYSPGRTIWQHKKVIDRMGPNARRATEVKVLKALAELRGLLEPKAGRKTRKAVRPKGRAVDRARHREAPMTPEQMSEPAVSAPAAVTIPAFVNAAAPVAVAPPPRPIAAPSIQEPTTTSSEPFPGEDPYLGALPVEAEPPSERITNVATERSAKVTTMPRIDPEEEIEALMATFSTRRR